MAHSLFEFNWFLFSWCVSQALTRTLLSSARTCPPPHRKKGRKRRQRMVSWRSRRCWCSTWEIQKPSPYKWREQSPSSTPCSTWKPLQVDGATRHSENQLKCAFPYNLRIYLLMRCKYLHILQQKCLVLLVVQEAVQFCVTVCEFSVANSVSGVRKMLPLVWSTDAAIKDAVVQAYRRLYLNPQGDTTRSVKQLHLLNNIKSHELWNKYKYPLKVFVVLI